MTDPATLVLELVRIRKLIAAALLGKIPLASPDFDRTLLDAKIFEEVMLIRRRVLRLWSLPPPVSLPAPDHGPEQAFEAKVLGALGELQQFVLQHPVAAQKIFASLVVQGRAYAATEKGAARARSLARTPELTRARQFWESSLASLLDEDRDAVLPSSYVEIVMQGARVRSPEALLPKIPATIGKPVP